MLTRCSIVRGYDQVTRRGWHDLLRGIGRASWAVTFRVDDLDAMVAQLADAGESVRVDPEAYPNGRFAALDDPEGNHVQLWQPAGADLRGPG